MSIEVTGTKARVLALGDMSQTGMFFTNEGVEYVDTGPFDAILLASHLQTVKRHQVPKVMSELYKELVNGGRIIVTVPSLEWACREVCTQNDISLGAYLSIYGTESENYLCGFTMLWLRRCLEEAGFIIVEARTQTFKLNIHIGNVTKEEKAKQHVIIGVKREIDLEKALEWMDETSH